MEAVGQVIGMHARRTKDGDTAPVLVRPAGSGEDGRDVEEVAVDPLRVKIATVTELFGTHTRAAEFLGVARSQPGRWLRGRESPNPRARRLIRDLDYVWGRLTDDRPAEVATIWLHSPNAFLDGVAPIDWLRTRGPEDVVGALDAEEAGSYP